MVLITAQLGVARPDWGQRKVRMITPSSHLHLRKLGWRHVLPMVFSEIPRFTIHDRWSDIWLSIMEDEMATCFLWGVLQNIWSMRLQECLANLVGNVILGKKLFVHIKSKNSPNFSRSEICNKFILKSPTIAAYVFSLWSISIIGESSNTNCCIFTLLLLSWGGR